jgi:hypothetical protein
VAGDIVTMLEPRLFPCGQDTYTSDDYYTPAWVFERMGIDFDLDVCAPPGGIPWIPAARFFTQEDDGLAQPWEGRVWMNPPFSRSGVVGKDASVRRAGFRTGTGDWVRRFIEHGHGIALTQVSRSNWWASLWNEADAVVMRHPLLFVGEDPARKSIFMPTAFAAFGEECVEAISKLGRVRR